MGESVNRAEYCGTYDVVRADFEESVAQFGLPFEAAESCPRAHRLELVREVNAVGQGADESHDEVRQSLRCENGDASLWRGWISPACLACRKGERTATFFVSLKCTKHCYFCFNPNQEDYEFFRTHTRDIAEELRQAHAQGAQFDCLAITGGEPCLHKPEVLEFLRCAKELYPGVHVRIYTSGDLLDDAFLNDLAEAGLDELRFSVKPQDTDGDQEELFKRMAAAVRVIPDVMVEMPVMPGEEQEMRDLLLRLDELGIRGINLLELCFPLHNEQEFKRRGFKLRRKPYKVLYNYWYAGGLPIAGSEAACLDLLRFSEERGLRMGVHYCSLDNKNTGQVFQQNRGFLLDDGFARSHAWLAMDEADYFLKCVKAFGEDALRVRDWLSSKEGTEAVELAEAKAFASKALSREMVDDGSLCAQVEPRDPQERQAGSSDAASVPQRVQRPFAVRFDRTAYKRVASLNDEIRRVMDNRAVFLSEISAEDRVRFNSETPSVTFPAAWANAVQERFPEAELAECWHVVEFDESTGPVLREVYATPLV